MRPTTVIFAKFESIGHPDKTLDFHGSTKDMMEKLIRWIFTVHMGSKLRITVGRRESDVRTIQKGVHEDIMDLMEQTLSELMGEADESSQSGDD